MRRLILIIILAFLIFMGYEMIYLGETKVPSVSYPQLQKDNDNLLTKMATLEQKNTKEYAIKKQQLASTVQLYEQKKSIYEDLLATQSGKEIDTTELYDIDFLWTIFGNYASKNECVIQFNVNKSVSLENKSTAYTLCDLEFIIIGDYINITDFIYDIEDDDRFGFEIKKFALVKADTTTISALYPKNTPTEIFDKKVKATFKIEGAPIDASTISSVVDTEAPVSTDANISQSGVTTAQPSQQPK